MNEFEVIKHYFAPLAKGEYGALSLTDDAAVLSVPEGLELIVTKDAICEGVHFIGNEEPSLIARKLLRVNLSDLTAMGATPYGYFLALMLHDAADEAWLASFSGGLKNDQERFGIRLMGGDTTRSHSTLSLSLTAFGTAPRGQALKRVGAKAGDGVYVTGTIGDAALGLQIAQGHLRAEKEAVDYLLGRYQLPVPRVELGQMLRGIATACIDISDGLIQDLGHVAECSGIAAAVVWEKIPLSGAARGCLAQFDSAYEIIAAGGDDYELLFTAPQNAHESLQSIAREAKVAITQIGEIKEGSGVKLVDKQGKDILLGKSGYDHFR